MATKLSGGRTHRYFAYARQGSSACEILHFVLHSAFFRTLSASQIYLTTAGGRFEVQDTESLFQSRSTRSVKKPSRFEPVLHGQGGENTPSKEGSPASPIAKVLFETSSSSAEQSFAST